ncbi:MULTISPECIES: type VII secretion-associated serine protease mycosin [Streptomycetaceae]|uniref:Serine protease membrane protein n=1 Tax=Streptantibioticus cattleyicolor (strain ATCC 35852 / DSM 46488 / JCM 4925 / NBRC 14057 / NRRL 8057) TaxID=1003195 RepID=F8K2Q1_STREN|nr:type VII secretion-associated serine protease mycosin [Streptantibioticus cattleyicolor]AEW97563.1 serine protease membrane protein [Streptantibioticus cattleyicolor NRRL 8057 = DSM 46488]MYS61995.1 type VII secretion-associated serine protease mycosin [Streptomyces sp. SID5468]CCB77888.1 putative serine protease (membrane protein) [Streptantibioticus cattleyicolor NRRL 8057 = DSM 46488]
MTVRPHRALTALLAALALVLLPVAAVHADPIRDQQWPLQTLDAQAAWETTRGAGVTVAVLDTGVDATHPDLTGNVLDGTDLVGFGARRGDTSWARHGTAMAGIIAGHGHGPGHDSGVMGIAPQARILPVRVILEDSDPQRRQARSTRGGALAQGIRWAVDHGADVINLSLGDDSDSAHPDAAEDDAVQYALGKGVVLVASAGNGGEDGSPVSYPAAYPGVIAVAAVDRHGRRAAFSTRRWYAAVGAPGVDVVIADPDRRYYEGWGTSAAAAYVSGTAALLRSAYPRLSPAQVKQVLESTTQDAPADGRDDAVGTGMIDPPAALAAAARLTAAAPTPPVARYARRYFGPGPQAAPPAARPASGTGALATAGALAGLALLVAAGILRAVAAGRRR